MSLILALIIGSFFGFVLQKTGAANPEKIINMLRLKDFHLMKTIFLGIGLSSLFLFLLMSAGLIDAHHLSIKTTHLGVLIGGGIMGTGWAISGFCPGTGVVAAGALRKDAPFFLFGGLAGALLFTLFYGSIKATGILDSIWGGKSTLAETGIGKYNTLIQFPGITVAGAIALLFILIALLLPSKKNDFE